VKRLSTAIQTILFVAVGVLWMHPSSSPGESYYQHDILTDLTVTTGDVTISAGNLILTAGTITNGDAKLATTDVTTNNGSSSKHGFAPKSPGDATQFLNGASTEAFAQVKDSDLATTDVTTNNATSSKHGFAPKSPSDATQFLNGASTEAFAQVKDSDLAVTDVTTNNVSTSAHGFITKAPNNVGQFYRGDAAWAYPHPWDGVLAGAFGDGNPNILMSFCINGANTASTPTNISTSVARCLAFSLAAPLTVNKLRFFGLATVTSCYDVAIYRYSDLARLTSELDFDTAAGWGSAGSSLGVTLSANTVYFVAVSTRTTGTTAGIHCFNTGPTAGTRLVNTIPSSLPGSLSFSTGALTAFQFQFAVTSGALPNPAATLAAPTAWTGGFPAFWLDNSNS